MEQLDFKIFEYPNIFSLMQILKIEGNSAFLFTMLSMIFYYFTWNHSLTAALTQICCVKSILYKGNKTDYLPCFYLLLNKLHKWIFICYTISFDISNNFVCFDVLKGNKIYIIYSVIYSCYVKYVRAENFCYWMQNCIFINKCFNVFWLPFGFIAPKT